MGLKYKENDKRHENELNKDIDYLAQALSLDINTTTSDAIIKVEQ